MHAWMWPLTEKHAVVYTNDRATLNAVLAYARFPHKDASRAVTYGRGANGRAFAWQLTFPREIWNGLVRHLGRAAVTYLDGPQPAPEQPAAPSPARTGRNRPGEGRTSKGEGTKAPSRGAGRNQAPVANARRDAPPAAPLGADNGKQTLVGNARRGAPPATSLAGGSRKQTPVGNARRSIRFKKIKGYSWTNQRAGRPGILVESGA